MIPQHKIKEFVDRHITGDNEAIYLYDPEPLSRDARIVEKMLDNSELILVEADTLNTLVEGFKDPIHPGDGDYERTLRQIETVLDHLTDLGENIQSLTPLTLNLSNLPKLNKLIEAYNVKSAG